MSKVQSVFWRRVTSLRRGGGFNWRGYFSVGGYQFLWRRESSASGVGDHTSLGGGVHFDLEEGV